jgi:hypothetical protein
MTGVGGDKPSTREGRSVTGCAGNFLKPILLLLTCFYRKAKILKCQKSQVRTGVCVGMERFV